VTSASRSNEGQPVRTCGAVMSSRSRLSLAGRTGKRSHGRPARGLVDRGRWQTQVIGTPGERRVLIHHGRT
jgi:hypothetical protein